MTDYRDHVVIGSRNSSMSYGRWWVPITLCICSLIVVVAFGIGFLVLPAARQHRTSMSMTQNMEDALGHRSKPAATELVPAEINVPSTIVWDEPTIRMASNGDAVRGQRVAEDCIACHGDHGRSTQGWIPTLAGVNSLVIFKELSDFRWQSRMAGPMPAIAAALTTQQSADVAAYYASMSGGVYVDSIHAPRSGRSLRDKNPTLRMIYAGDPVRGLPGCTSCHGPGAYRVGAPSLTGQNRIYMANQLESFSTGGRRNDINMPMRTIARLLTATERNDLAKYFAEGPATVN